MDYNVTVYRSNNEELLVNLVRAKYFEHPFFLQVGAIAPQFNYSASAGVSADLQRKSVGGAQVFHPSLGASVAEIPTVTYAPVLGAENVRKLLTEFGLDAFVLLARATVPMDVLMRILVKNIGELDGSPQQKLEVPSGVESSYDRFLRLAILLRRLQDLGDLEFLLLKTEPGEVESATMVMHFRDLAEFEGAERLLGVKAEQRRDSQGRLLLTVRLFPLRDLSLIPQKKWRSPSSPSGYEASSKSSTSSPGESRCRRRIWSRGSPGDTSPPKGKYPTSGRSPRISWTFGARRVPPETPTWRSRTGGCGTSSPTTT